MELELVHEMVDAGGSTSESQRQDERDEHDKHAKRFEGR